jgi:hypothetical protein
MMRSSAAAHAGMVFYELCIPDLQGHGEGGVVVMLVLSLV